MKQIIAIFVLLSLLFLQSNANAFETDTLQTNQGPLLMTFVGHGTLYFEHDNKVVHVDPWSRLANYSTLPKADLILITHQHRDHLDSQAIEACRKEDTAIVLTKTCAEEIDGIVFHNGDTKTIKDIKINAVPAYNIKHKRGENKPFHPKGEGNGYVITFGDKNIYIAGDTENVPEMAELNGTIDVAFLPMNLPYTMTPEMAAAAATLVGPKILYPYHFGESDVSQLVTLLNDTEIEIRVRKLQ
jgi:L-ascorbate metabolism protein UlaG (beta-lactamase superfamily)